MKVVIFVDVRVFYRESALFLPHVGHLDFPEVFIGILEPLDSNTLADERENFS